MAATKGFTYHLSMAVCEWFLMILMFMDAALGFILTKFARYCELQTPCLFCLRLDHVFGNEEPKFYLSLFCNKHRAEISNLVCCDLHDNLADIREMCDDCFVLMMIQNDSNSESCGIKEDHNVRMCSCCKKERKTKSSPQRFGDSKVSVKPPVPCVEGPRRVIHQDNFKNAKNNIGPDVDMGHNELKFNTDSDSVSGIPFSGNDNLIPVENQDPTETMHLHTVSDPEPSLPEVHNDENITIHGSISGSLVPQEVKETVPLEIKKDTNMEDDLSNPDEIHDKTDGYESPGGSSVSEIEGESLVDKLKRQVEYDRKLLRLLQMELEEERNAADITANEAMAMITRLQEEKSALHTEALQYLRMVEEQAEYDMETLDKANDLVDQKDKEIQDLEAELDYFRSRYDDELMMGNNNNNNNMGEHMGNGKIEKSSSSDSKFTKVLDPEDEKRYISQSLSELENKFHQFSSRNGTQSDHLIDENSFSKHKDSSKSNGMKRVSIDGGEFDVGTLGNEISDLNERLEALESDRDFLEHACNALQSNGGFEFIQEIGQHLQDLRRIRFDRR